MRIKFLVTFAATSAVLVTLTVAPAGADAPDSAACVDTWNRTANSAGQQDLSAEFGDNDSGWVVVGTDGDCVLAAYNTSNPTYAVWRESDGEFVWEGDRPGNQFTAYRASIDPVDVILQPSGVVVPVAP